jgi:myosin heavy subunit
MELLVAERDMQMTLATQAQERESAARRELREASQQNASVDELGARLADAQRSLSDVNLSKEAQTAEYYVMKEKFAVMQEALANNQPDAAKLDELTQALVDLQRQHAELQSDKIRLRKAEEDSEMRYRMAEETAAKTRENWQRNENAQQALYAEKDALRKEQQEHAAHITKLKEELQEGRAVELALRKAHADELGALKSELFEECRMRNDQSQQVVANRGSVRKAANSLLGNKAIDDGMSSDEFKFSTPGSSPAGLHSGSPSDNKLNLSMRSMHTIWSELDEMKKERDEARLQVVSLKKSLDGFTVSPSHSTASLIQQDRVQSMLKRLIEELDIRSLLCNSQQHQIVSLEHKDTVLKPSEFASLLKENDRLCEIIRDGLAEKGYGGATFNADANTKRFNVWKRDYIKTFGS